MFPLLAPHYTYVWRHVASASPPGFSSRGFPTQLGIDLLFGPLGPPPGFSWGFSPPFPVSFYGWMGASKPTGLETDTWSSQSGPLLGLYFVTF